MAALLCALLLCICCWGAAVSKALLLLSALLCALLLCICGWGAAVSKALLFLAALLCARLLCTLPALLALFPVSHSAIHGGVTHKSGALFR